MMVIFTENALEEYISWQTEDKKTLRRINQLIKDIQRNGLLVGIGKPEALKGRKALSRIDEENRLVYFADDRQNLILLSCKGHYID